MILLKINKEDTSPSYRFVRFPKRQIFVEMFRRNLQSSVAMLVHICCAPIWRPENSVNTFFSGTYFGYLNDLLSVLNKQAFT